MDGVGKLIDYMSYMLAKDDSSLVLTEGAPFRKVKEE